MTEQTVDLKTAMTTERLPDAEFNWGVFQGQLWGSREVYKIGGMVVAEKQASSEGWPQLTPEFEKLLKQKVKEWVKEE
jgi:hypothetical protein